MHAATPPTILLAMEASSWRQELVKRVEKEEAFLQLCDDGQELLKRSLGWMRNPASAPTACVIGPGLKGITGLDVLYLANKAAQESQRSSLSEAIKAILLVTDIQYDVELLEFLAQRGIKGFISPDAQANFAVAKVVEAIYKENRQTKRYQVNIPSSLTFAGEPFEAIIGDISKGGARVEVYSVGRKPPPGLGSLVQLCISHSGEEPLVLEAEVRRVQAYKGWWRKRWAVGLRFTELGEEKVDRLEDFLRRWNEAQESMSVWNMAQF